MARIDEMLGHVADEKLRRELADAVAELRRRKKFGLVYEEHIPETVLLGAETGIRVGAQVMRRRHPEDRTRYLVDEVAGDSATIRNAINKEQAKIADLLVVIPFGEPVYPVLRLSDDPIVRSPNKPFHTVINGENFHALQLLLFAYEGKVDLIYVDPPYNTGARDWKYNNDYVDRSDTWHHSKWLSMIEKRLRLAKRLLGPDGILVVTIDEHEVNNLGVLIREELFKELPQEAIQMVTIVNNPKGVTQDRFSRVEEYAFFVFLNGASVTSIGDDLLTLGADDLEKTADAEHSDQRPRWKGLLRSGTNARRADRKRMFYPVLIDESKGAVIDAGEPLAFEGAPNFKKKIKGLTPVWPIRRDGSLGNWGVGHTTLRQLISKGYVAVGGYDKKRNTWGLTYLSKEPQEQIAAGILEVRNFDKTRNVVDVVYTDPSAAGRRMKTVWHRTRHDAGTGGTDVISALLGERAFSFPKSLYAVRDTLAAALGDRPDALILDFFAGSGTTLHAAALLNSEDGGQRRCILVSNNEVSEEASRELTAAGFFVGDQQYEARGVCKAVTWPRVKAALSGRRPDGALVPGEHLGGRAYAEGFVENAVFFDLAYEDADAIEVGEKFADVLPSLWLAAGARGDPRRLDSNVDWSIPDVSCFAVLLDEDRFSDFSGAIAKMTAITHVWIVTDSEPAFARLSQNLPDRFSVGMLYRDYLHNFRINTETSR